MIVPVSSEKYDNLFAEATEFLQTAKDKNGNLLFSDVATIDSLNAYYGHMKDFYQAAQNNNKNGYKYVLMPMNGVGEESFLVDLNSRTITVPTAFSKIGGVQADQMAELLIFSADRYFDYMDLANTLIYVQWQLPDAKHTTGATEITMIDLETEPGKIRFAWPLHDIITEHSGVVRFSIRFFLFDNENKLSYSLNTLEANLIIKPALDPSSKIDPEETGGLFEKAIINSLFSNSGLVPPVYPSFEEPGMEMTIGAEDFVRYLSEADEGKKTRVAKLGDDDALEMKAQAVVADSGILTYMWMFKPDEENAGWRQLGAGEFTYEPAKLAVDSSTQRPYLNYRDAYFYKDEESEEYLPYRGYDVPVNENGEYDNSLFEKYAVYRIYPIFVEKTYENEEAFVADTAEKFVKNNDKYIPETAYDASKIYYVKNDKATEEPVVGTYSLVATNTIQNLKRDKWSTYCYLPGPAEIKFVEHNPFDVDTNKKTIKVNLIEDVNNPTVDFFWYYDAKNAETAITKASGEGLGEGADADMTTLPPGWYAAKVIADLNRKKQIKGTPTAQVIYADPVIASVKPSDENPAYNLGPGDIKELQLVVDVPLPEGFTAASDIATELYRNLSYEWQYRRSDTTTWKTINSSMVSETDITKLVHSINDEKGSITVRNVEDMTAYQYRCIVTNTLGNKHTTATLGDTDLFLVY